MNGNRRSFLKQTSITFGKWLFAYTALAKLTGCADSVSGQGRVSGVSGASEQPHRAAYRIDSEKCVACGLCAAVCVQKPIPAIQAVNDLARCGQCEHCPAKTAPPPEGPGGAERRICQYDAFLQEQLTVDRYAYTIDETRCRGCGECVTRCIEQCNGSLSMQVIASRCLRCDVCVAQQACKYDAIVEA